MKWHWLQRIWARLRPLATSAASANGPATSGTRVPTNPQRAIPGARSMPYPSLCIDRRCQRSVPGSARDDRALRVLLTRGASAIQPLLHRRRGRQPGQRRLLPFRYPRFGQNGRRRCRRVQHRKYRPATGGDAHSTRCRGMHSTMHVAASRSRSFRISFLQSMDSWRPVTIS
jgi:hypothetical protein